MIFRNRSGEAIDREQAEALIRDDGLEVRSDVFRFNGQNMVVKSRLQPVCNEIDEPLFLTMVFGDEELGMQELPTASEEECRQLHHALVERYLLIQRNRENGMSKVLLRGSL